MEFLEREQPRGGRVASALGGKGLPWPAGAGELVLFLEAASDPGHWAHWQATRSLRRDDIASIAVRKMECSRDERVVFSRRS